MGKNREDNVTCQICKQKKKPQESVRVDTVRDPVADAIKRDHPDLPPGGYICLEDLGRYREDHIRSILRAEKGDLTALELNVLKSLKARELLTRNINREFDRDLPLGERIADRMAEFGGSWRFILTFLAIIFTWIIVNSLVLIQRPFDPYPFILLNLVLSCLAAVQAPVIMMSQNRQEAKDRLRAEHDYQINLKAELEIRQLNEKLDHLIHHQWQRLLEIQQIHLDLTEQILREKTR